MSFNIEHKKSSAYLIILIAFLITITSLLCLGCNRIYGTSPSPTEASTAITTNSTQSLEFKYHMNPNNMLASLIETRNLHFLKELTSKEHGKSISELQSGTYFFLSPHYLVTNSTDSTRFWSRSIISSYPRFELDYYEIHYLSESKIEVMAFISEDDAYKLHKLDGHVKQKVTLAPMPFDEKINTLVSLPYSRILEATIHITQSKDQEDMYLLDTIVQ